MNGMEDFLKHNGTKGMKWGVVKWRTPKSTATKAKTAKSSRMRQEWDSLKRERHWKAALKDIDNMSTKKIGDVSRRVSLENELKRLSKSGVGGVKDKKDYRLRAKMSDQELNRKVGRLRAKASLSSQVSTATKEQRMIGQKIAATGGSILLKYATTKKISVGDVIGAISNPKDVKDLKSQAMSMVVDMAVKKVKTGS